MADNNLNVILVNSGLLTFSLGVFSISILMRFHPKFEMDLYRKRSIIDKLEASPFIISSSFCILVCLTASYFLFKKLGIPLFAKNVSFSYIKFARHGGWSGWQLLSIHCILPLTCLLLLGKGKLHRNKKIIQLGLVLTILTILLMILTSRRYIIFDFIIWIMSLFSYIGEEKLRFSWKKLLAFTFFILIIFSGLDIFRTPSYKGGLHSIREIPFLVWKTIEHRVLLSEARGIYTILDLFPSKKNFFWGYTYIDQITSYGPGIAPKFNLGRWLYQERLYYFVGKYIPLDAGYLPPTFFGELYANFGLLSLIGMFVWGMFLQVLFIHFIRNKKKYLHRIVLYSIAFPFLARSCLLGFYEPLNFTVSYVIFFFIIIFAIPNALLKKVKNNQ